jgi:hypothetical protein
MTACRPLYTRLHCLDYKSTGLRPKILPPQSRDNKATGIWPDNSDVTLHSYRLQCTWQFLKLHGCASRCTAAAAASQTEYKCYAVTSSGRIPNCMHAAAVALLQWQVIKLLHWVKDEQTCNNNSNNSNSNKKARCIPAELCKLSRVKNVVDERLIWVYYTAVAAVARFQTAAVGGSQTAADKYVAGSPTAAAKVICSGKGSSNFQVNPR